MIALIGKTCSGKDTIKKELIKLGMESVVTTTTRPMRDGEVQDVSYHFIDKSMFRRFKLQNLFAETTYYNTVYGTWYYGTQFKDLKDGANKVVILNPNGIRTLSEKMDLSDWLVVYVYCSDDVIRERLVNRGDNPEEAERRLRADKNDFVNICRFTDIVVANNGTETPEKIAKKIKTYYERKEKC